MWPGPFGRDHDHVVARGRRDSAVVDREAVREEHRRAGVEVRRDLVAEERSLRAVGNEQRHELGAAHRVGDVAHRQPGLLRRARARRCPAAARPRPRCPSRRGSARGRAPGCRSRGSRPCPRAGSMLPVLITSAIGSSFRLRDGCGLRSSCDAGPACAGRSARCARARARRGDARALRMRRAARAGRRSRT